MSTPRKVLLVSPYPYSSSSRGMDVLTGCFEEEGWNTVHLTYPRAFYTPSVQPPENTKVTTVLARKSNVPYVDRFMFWFPKLLFNAIKRSNNKCVKEINFSAFDFIVLESGKPLFLMDLIPTEIPIIYRLSDSVQLVLGKNRHYKNLEKKIFEISARMIFKKEVYRTSLEAHQKEKTTVIENGMVIPHDISSYPSFPKGTTNAVYVGLHQLDAPTVELLLRHFDGKSSQNKLANTELNLSDPPEIHFHIIGPCLGKRSIKQLSHYSNFHYSSFLSKEDYMPLLRDADLAIFPFKRTEAMRWFGLTSKLLHFMYFGLPIISYPTGIEGEFNGLPVIFADNKREFVQSTEQAITDGWKLSNKKEKNVTKKIDYGIDFDYYSEESRKREYKEFIRTL